MEVLVINCGSSSLKFQLIDSDSEKVLAKGICERIGIKGSLITYQPTGGEKEVSNIDMPTHHEAIDAVIKALTNKETGVIDDMSEVKAVGHRVVHGGEKYNASVVIDSEVKAYIEECFKLAPLHNPANMIGINACEELMPNTPMVAVFDTAFHQTMPDYAYMYAVPYELYEKYGVRRYGFHGTSHRYVSKRVCEFLGVQPEGKKIITCHIGNGGSVSAIKDGKCMDTSMGLTPLEGLMMGTRSGDIDAGAVTFIMDKENLDANGVSNLLNKKSGVMGIFGESSDMRDLENAVAAGNPRAILAEKMYFYRIKKYVGAYAAALGGVDIIVFTGGVGENQCNCRSEVCEGLGFMGVKVDLEKNKVRGEEAVISTDDSKVKVVVIPTDEELMIASDTMAILSK